MPAHPAKPDPDLDLDGEIRALLDRADIEAGRDLIAQILATGVRLGQDGPERLDLKITNAAVAEMRSAFQIFAPFAEVSKVTVFGSARTRTTDPLYDHTRRLATALAEAGWMVVTGAGPGIMGAAAEGAGPDASIGVSIRLPFEAPNEVLEDNPNHVTMKYFFTRKLMLVKESSAFVCLPGGFGTLDETFELLTLQQTGKAEPTPIVLLDIPGGTFWHGFQRFIEDQCVGLGVISPDDLDRVLITDSIDAAVNEIQGFWRNYDSMRWVGKRLVLRLRAEPTDAEVAALNEEFGDLVAQGRIERTGPLAAERSGKDRLHLSRLVLVLDQFEVGSLHRLIRAVNALDSAPMSPWTTSPGHLADSTDGR